MPRPFYLLRLLLPLLPLLSFAALGAADTAAGFGSDGPTVPFPRTLAPTPVEPVAIRQLRAKLGKYPTAAGYRSLADACVKAGLYQQASEAYRKEAAIHRARGDHNAAKVEDGKANWWSSRLALYREVEVPYAQASGGAKWEPAYGCYVGAMVERDPRVARHEDFNELTGKDHAVFADYRSYGREFPAGWAERLRDAGAAAQIAFEPNRGLQHVRDDAYLREFAQAAADAEIPIFLRFAAEMNGDWTRWSGRPDEYIRKWRLVHGVMRRLAPNVAMVWTPNATPEHNISDYYPGDQYVDWVGVNFYTVHHHDNDVDRPADREDPADVLEHVYQKYAARKPVMICEYAATHFCRADEKRLPGFARDKLQMLYSALPRRYPRVKAVHWYDVDNTTHAVFKDRDFNNFSLTENPHVLGGYRDVVRSPYFLSRPVTDKIQEDAVRYEEIREGARLSGTVRLSAWAKTYHDRPTVGYRLDGKAQLATTSRPYEAVWDTTRVSNGQHVLEAIAWVNGRPAVQRRLTVRVAN